MSWDTRASAPRYRRLMCGRYADRRHADELEDYYRSGGAIERNATHRLSDWLGE